MGGRWLVQAWFLFSIAVVAACGDNSRTGEDAGPPADSRPTDGPRDAAPSDGAPDAMVDAMVDAAIDAPPDAPPDAPIDAPPDAPPVDAACSTGVTPMWCPAPGGCTDLSIDPLNCGACGTTCDVGAGEMCLSGVCCGGGTSNCSGQCVDFQSDNMNCGGCGVTCGSGETCTSGVCRTDCTTGQANCGTAPGTCADLQVDNANCGACGNACGAGETCSGGACVCATPDTCSGTCTDTNNDPANCGACGTACATGEVCNNGVCTTTCQSPTQDCNGSCADLQSDPANCGQCGNACGAGEVCNAGACTATACGGTTTACYGACVDTGTDEGHCGNCDTACPLGASCTSGGCACPGGAPDTCNGVCVNTASDEANCGACGTTCASGETCEAGVCTTVCGGTTPDLCLPAPGICTDFDTDENNCGGCGVQCGGNQTCTAGVCLTDCGGLTPDRCGTAPGFCTNVQTDDNNCGSCGPASACDPDRDCISGQCECAGTTPDECNGACTNTLTDAANCGVCGNACPATAPLCSGGQCVEDCSLVAGSTQCSGACVDLQTDPSNCGACGTPCPAGGVCSNGTCSCPAGSIDCNDECVVLGTDENNCGACGVTCAVGEQCTSGVCCGTSETACNGTCANLTTDPLNCGTCGNTCASGQQCNNGVCECPYGESACNGQCVPTANDPNNCGGCGITCGVGEACVSNGCIATCPAPLTECPIQSPAGRTECVNLGTDSDSCGNCGNACPTGQGCSDGACVPLVPVGADPAKCVNGGPPIFVPTGGGDTCTGSIGSVSFTFALCSRTDVGPLSQPVTTDAFDSTVGPYVPGQKGGGIGVNQTISDTAKLQIGGDLWVAGAAGMEMAGDVTVRQSLRVLESFKLAKLLTVEESAYIGGPISTQGNASGSIAGTLHTEIPCASVPNALTYNTCVTEPVTFSAPPCGTGADLVPVTQIVEHFAIPANNDNALIGLSPDALRNASGPKRLDLPCGYYHLNAISGSAPITIVVHGRTALFITGAIDTSNEFYLDLEPGASLDVFIAGGMVSSQAISIGNPAYPRLSRIYIGDNGCAGTGACTSDTDCCSGVCTAGQCESAGGLSQALKLSGGASYLNGVFYAGYGTVRISNPLEMYGAIFANYYEASGETIIHYDNGVVQNGEECPPPPSGCGSCRDCNNQACINGECGSCTSDSQCCAPLRCFNGTCMLPTD